MEFEVGPSRLHRLDMRQRPPPWVRDPALTKGDVLVRRSGHTSARELTSDDILVPLGPTRRLGAADEGSRRILDQGPRLLEKADAR